MKTRFVLLLSAAVGMCGHLVAQVTFDRLLNAAKEPQNWLTYSGTMASNRYTQLNQIAPANVANLELQWVFQARSLEKFEATPLVVDGIMYTVQAPNDVVALDAATGRVFWTWSYIPSPETRVCCGRVNRGLAILGDTLYMGTVDAHLVAIDARNGKPLWDKKVGRAEAGYSLMHAPLIVKDKVIIGIAGGEYGIRGFIAAFDAKTGKEAWKFNTVAEPGEPGGDSWKNDAWKTGGGSIWVTGSYDPELNLTYWGVGNPAPDWNGDSRPGDNLYTDCVVALDADTGKLKWYYQFSPHDEFDYDSVQVPVLADVDWQGKPRKIMYWANRNGVFYALDRTSGQFLMGKPFVDVNWMNGFDEKGRPMRVPGKVPSLEGTLIYPGNQGGTNWYSPSFSPSTGFFYIPTWAGYASIYVKATDEYKEGNQYAGGTPRSPVPFSRSSQNYRKEDEGYGSIRALDPKTGERKWEFKMSDITEGGILTTASDLLFTGGREGYFLALDARKGRLLWKASLGGAISAGPISYSMGGKQYISISAGNSLFTFALRQ